MKKLEGYRSILLAIAGVAGGAVATWGDGTATWAVTIAVTLTMIGRALSASPLMPHLSYPAKRLVLVLLLASAEFVAALSGVDGASVSMESAEPAAIEAPAVVPDVVDDVAPDVVNEPDAIPRPDVPVPLMAGLIALGPLAAWRRRAGEILLLAVIGLSGCAGMLTCEVDRDALRRYACDARYELVHEAQPADPAGTPLTADDVSIRWATIAAQLDSMGAVCDAEAYPTTATDQPAIR